MILEPEKRLPVFSTAARFRFSRRQRGIMAALAVLCALLLVVVPLQFGRVLIVINLLAGAGFLAMRGAALSAALLRPEGDEPPPAPSQLPSVTILCPLYKEDLSVRNLIAALRGLDYPRGLLEIILLVEEDDHGTAQAIGRLPHFIRMEIVPAGGIRTKPNALNHGLIVSTGDLVGVYDAEDRPEADQLLKVAATFAAGPEELACVQARLNYYNREDGFIPRAFALEYALHFDWFLPGLSAMGLPLPLGGTSNFIRREALIEVGAWDPFNVTEDADLGLRLAAHGYSLTTVDSTTFEEATDTAGVWVKQRSRWLKGFLQTWFVHMRTKTAPGPSLVLHLALGVVVLSALLNPLTWALFAFWLTTQTALLDPLFAYGLKEACLILFIGGTVGHVWFMLVAPLKRGWLHLTYTIIFLPLYWALQSLAAYKALAGFVLNPHRWEKTAHSAGADPGRDAQHA